MTPTRLEFLKVAALAMSAPTLDRLIAPAHPMDPRGLAGWSGALIEIGPTLAPRYRVYGEVGVRPGSYHPGDRFDFYAMKYDREFVRGFDRDSLMYMDFIGSIVVDDSRASGFRWTIGAWCPREVGTHLVVVNDPQDRNNATSADIALMPLYAEYDYPRSGAIEDRTAPLEEVTVSKAWGLFSVT
jgi:hypothetical protein